MCATCGCSDRDTPAAIAVERGLLEENDRVAAHNREHFAAHGVLALNLMSSPGSGKTSLLEASIRALSARGLNVAVIEGDLETENDAERIRKLGVPAVQITTGSACHLDAAMVHRALHDLDLVGLDVLFVENVGNLVCPAEFDLGQHASVVLLAVTEGDDKPQKYPIIFRAADHVLITKADLLPHVGEFDVARARRHLGEIAPATPASLVSAKSGEGLDAWLEWIEARRAALGPARHHRHHHHSHD